MLCYEGSKSLREKSLCCQYLSFMFHLGCVVTAAKFSITLCLFFTICQYSMFTFVEFWQIQLHFGGEKKLHKPDSQPQAIRNFNRYFVVIFVVVILGRFSLLIQKP